MKNLYWNGNAYDLENTEKLFVDKMIENMLFQYENCEEYRCHESGGRKNGKDAVSPGFLKG